jgi:flagellar motility protein MotE (MotC chaperone)
MTPEQLAILLPPIAGVIVAIGVLITAIAYARRKEVDIADTLADTLTGQLTYVTRQLDSANATIKVIRDEQQKQEVITNTYLVQWQASTVKLEQAARDLEQRTTRFDALQTTANNSLERIEALRSTFQEIIDMRDGGAKESAAALKRDDENK